LRVCLAARLPVERVVHLLVYPPDLGGNGAEHRLMHSRNT
jgi:hypothetical protein